MLSFAFSPAGRLPKHTPTKYPDVLKVNGAFTVTIDGKVYFTEPSFPVYEFLSQANEWVSGEGIPDNMEYSSLETDENPLISFSKNTKGTYSLKSPWAEFDCSTDFSLDEIRKAISDLNAVVR